jgi:Zn finger protein HypA/HybF involved in hydrogenase expression
MSKAPTICEYCEKVFMGGEKAFICPKCRKKALSERAKKINLSKMGNEARRKGGEQNAQ